MNRAELATYIAQAELGHASGCPTGIRTHGIEEQRVKRCETCRRKLRADRGDALELGLCARCLRAEPRESVRR